ncbi:MAG: hypothetical protein DYH03_16475 [Nitrospira sp. NTP1]|nr:hypothetical protein [Nitrospira sp. NTP1]
MVHLRFGLSDRPSVIFAAESAEPMIIERNASIQLWREGIGSALDPMDGPSDDRLGGGRITWTAAANRTALALTPFFSLC